jgi:FKBP-type peptidyl-prolyl cis-trans isomerase
MRSLISKSLLLILPLALGLAGCKSQSPSTGETTPPPREVTSTNNKEKNPVEAARTLGTKTDKPVIKTDSGLQYIDVKEGTGAAAKAGDTVSVHYTGWLVEGKKFDSSVDRGQPFSFPLGGGRVIKGWDEGVAGMKVTGIRKLIIPSDLGYGARGAGSAIPPDATLIFEVQLLEVK